MFIIPWIVMAYGNRNSTDYSNTPFLFTGGTLGFARHDKCVQNANAAAAVPVPPVALGISSSLGCVVRSSRGHHERRAPMPLFSVR